MPINKKCLACSQLSFEEAKQFHGEDGDGCWDPKICHRRRSHYRHRQKINPIRTYKRRLQQQGRNPTEEEGKTTNDAGEQPVAISLPVPSQSLAAILTLYRNRKDSPVHAVSAEVYQGDRLVASIQPIHCMGMKADQLARYIKESVLGVIQQQFKIDRFEDVIRELPIEQCPIHPCPLRAPIIHPSPLNR